MTTAATSRPTAPDHLRRTLALVARGTAFALNARLSADEIAAALDRAADHPEEYSPALPSLAVGCWGQFCVGTAEAVGDDPGPLVARVVVPGDGRRVRLLEAEVVLIGADRPAAGGKIDVRGVWYSADQAWVDCKRLPQLIRVDLTEAEREFIRSGRISGS